MYHIFSITSCPRIEATRLVYEMASNQKRLLLKKKAVIGISLVNEERLLLEKRLLIEKYNLKYLILFITSVSNSKVRLVPAILGDGSQYAAPKYYPSSGVDSRSIISVYAVYTIHNM